MAIDGSWSRGGGGDCLSVYLYQILSLCLISSTYTVASSYLCRITPYTSSKMFYYRVAKEGGVAFDSG